MTRPSLALLVVLAAPSPWARDASLAAGGFQPPRAGAAAVRPGPPSAASAEVRRLLGLGAAPVPILERAAPKSLGDRLVMSVDDGVDPVGPAWEGRLDVSGGAAGPSDAVAVRFPMQSLGTPPLDVTGAIVGLDDRHGVTTWAVETWLEDVNDPLQPRRGTTSAAAALDASSAGLVATTAPRPTAFQRVRAPLRMTVPDAWLSDGAFDDDFARSDGPLSDGNGDWLECEDGACGRVPLDVDVVSGAAVRTTGGGRLLVVKFPALDVESRRPHRDIDITASVDVRDDTVGFTRAGLALRVMASDAFYRVEYQRTPSQVVVTAVLPAPIGEVPIGTLPVSSPSSGSRRLLVRVTGTDPVAFDVSVDGLVNGRVSDATWRLTGWYAGLSASDPATRAETWDSFRVERHPDVFAVVGFPPGEDVGLPADRSTFSLASESLLLSADGASFVPATATAPCFNPGNPFVQLEVEDTTLGDALFEREGRVAAVSLACASCPEGPERCARNLSIAERMRPTLTSGEAASVAVRFWDEHLLSDTLIFTGDLWEGSCDARTNLVTSGVAVGVASLPQAAGSAATQEVTLMSFTPVAAGPHCLVIQELHDANGDCCPDGEETSPLGGCPGACAPVPPSDSNAATRVTLVDLLVEDACRALAEDVMRDGPDDVTGDGVTDEINLDGGSLRVTRAAGDDVTLAWSVVDPVVPAARYNLHLLDAAIFDRSACFLDEAPVVGLVVGRTVQTMTVPSSAAPVWLAVYESGGCGAEASVVDASHDDPARRVPCP